MRRFLAAVVLLASMVSATNAEPKLPTGGTAQGFIVCGYPACEETVYFGPVHFQGVLAIAGKRYVGDFATNGAYGYLTGDGTGTIDPVTLSGKNYGSGAGLELLGTDENELGRTVEGKCTGRIDRTQAWTRVVFDCTASVSGGHVAPVRLVTLFQELGSLEDSGGGGPPCVCIDLIGYYFRQA